jgi:hypothetical protein
VVRAIEPRAFAHSLIPRLHLDLNDSRDRKPGAAWSSEQVVAE